MTVIIALNDKKNKRIIIGSDGQITKGDLKYSDNSNKLISKRFNIIDGYDEIVSTETLHLAMAGYAFLKDYIKYNYTMPDMKENQDFIDYLYNDFLYGLREELLERKLLGTSNEIFNSEANILLIYEDTIYEIDRNFSINKLRDDYCVGGSGWELAIGSLYTNLHFHKHIDPVEAVRQAIITCGVHNVYCNNTINLEIINYG